MATFKLIVAALVFIAFARTAAIAANTVDTGTLTWSCERDLSVKLNQQNGEFRIKMPSEKINTTLFFASCNSSHCSWQQRRGMPGDICYNKVGSGDLCLTITADYRTQSLAIFSSADIVVAGCIAYKSKDAWNEAPKAGDNPAD